MIRTPHLSPAPRHVIITGASQGLGRALALALAATGAELVLVARSKSALDEVVEAIVAGGGVAHAITADVADKRAAHRIAQTAEALIGPVDTLIHNASTLGPLPLAPLLDTDCEDLAQVLETNLVGPFRLTKVVAGAMALRGAGTVVHISSDAAESAYADWGAYGVSKAAHDHLQRIFAVENPSLTFLSIDPGEMDTAMHAAALPDADREELAKPERIAPVIVRIITGSGPSDSGRRFTSSSLANEVAP